MSARDNAQRNIHLCNCNGTMLLDAAVLERALELAGPLPIHTQLCQKELAAFADRASGDVLVACTQEARLFGDVADDAGKAQTIRFVNVRESAGWSGEATRAMPKIAALIAAAVLPDPQPVPRVSFKSGGQLLIIGPAAAALPWAERLRTHLAVTVLIAAVPVFGTLFYLLPFASDFPSMAAALAPLLVVCGFIIAEPGIGPFGTFAAVYFSVVSNIDNVMPYDSVGFLNNSVAILIGIGVALVLFATFFPETSAQAGRRFRRQLLVGLSRLAGARYPLSKLMKAPFMNDSPRYWGVSRTSQMRHAGALRAL